MIRKLVADWHGVKDSCFVCMNYKRGKQDFKTKASILEKRKRQRLRPWFTVKLQTKQACFCVIDICVFYKIYYRLRVRERIL